MKQFECLDDVIAEMKSNMTEEERQQVSTLDVREHTSRLHFLLPTSVGRLLRNELGLWRKETALVKYFNGIGIQHAEDMCAIIMTSLIRSVQQKPKQVLSYRNYWLGMNIDPDTMVKKEEK